MSYLIFHRKCIFGFSSKVILGVIIEGILGISEKVIFRQSPDLPSSSPRKRPRETNYQKGLSLYIFEKRGRLALFVRRSISSISMKRGSLKKSFKNRKKSEREGNQKRSQRVPKSRAKTATQAKRLRHQETGGNSVGNFGNSQTWSPRWA